jgi:hypothetical protein
VTSGATHVRVLRLALLFLALSGCTTDPIASVRPEDAACPDLTGSYCAIGLGYERGGHERTKTEIGGYLPAGDRALQLRSETRIDRVALRGGPDGQLTITAFSGDELVFEMRLAENELRCEANAIRIENPGQMWGGALPPIAAIGWSDAHTVLWRAEDGSLRARKMRRNTGLVSGIPVRIGEEFWARFESSEQGCE